MKKGIYIKRKANAFAFFMVVLMFLSCIFTVVLDSIRATNISKPVSDKGYTLRDADINDYDFENSLNPDAVFATNSIDKDEKVMVMIEIDDNSLGNNYLTYANSKYASLSDYVSSDIAQGYALNMKARQESLFNRLSAEFDIELKYSYTAFFNAFAAYVRYGDIKAIEKVDKVHNVIISERFDVPETLASSGGDIDFAENIVKVKETGIYDTSESKNTGLGTIVAVLDTGLDHQHPAFNNFDDINGHGKYYIEDIDGRLKNNPFAASGFSSGLSAKDVYINEKVPYAYDYADKDSEVFPTGNHGTHVAGIIAGHDEIIKGGAVGAQLAIMKVFSNEGSGAEVADILAAVEDCVHLDVDVINMSLGSSSGFAREKDHLRTNAAYDMVYAAGINLVVAAGNAYSSGFQSTYGLNLASNPDSATVGSPSTYNAALCVGSISGVKTPYMIAYDGNKDKQGKPADGIAIYYLNAFDNNGDELEFMERLLVENNTNIEEKEFDYVVVPGTGTSADYGGLNVRGKIAVVKRGIDTFVTKIEVARALGAIGVIIRNNVSGTIRMSLGNQELIPACSVKMDVGDKLYERAKQNSAAGRGDGGKLLLKRSYKAGPFMSDFSSWGPSPDLELKPEIIAHGGDITSADIGGGYERLSGTSMAAPNFAGVAALLRQHVIEHAGDYNIDKDDSSAIRTLVNQLFMSTGTIAINEFKDPYSPRKQGAGLADLKKAEDTRAYLYVKNSDGTEYDKTKLSMGDDKDRTGVYVLDFYLRNISNKALTYNINTIVLTEGLASDGKTVTEIPVVLSDAAKDAAKNVKVSSGGSYNSSKKTVTVNKNSDAHIQVTVKLTKNNKKYLNDTFKNGMFVEGFVELKPTVAGDGAVDLSIPYLAFYGDWSDAPILDKTIYETSPDEVNQNLQEHEKNKPDVLSVTPVGMASRDNEETTYLFHIGGQVYLAAEQFETPAVEMDRSALSLDAHGLFMLWGVTGFLRNAKTVKVKIKNAYTGQVMLDKPYQNAKKSTGMGGGFSDFDDELDIRKFASKEGIKFVEGGKYSFEMEAFLDWGDGQTYGNNNKFAFDFYVDSIAPEIVNVGVRLEKDKNFSNERHYIDFDIYDAQYSASLDLQYYNPIAKQYKSVFGKGNKPIISQRGGTTRVTVEVSNVWDLIVDNNYEMMVMVCDYAWNHTYQYLNIKESYNAIEQLVFDQRYASAPLEIATYEEFDLRKILTVTAEQDDRLAWDEDFVWESMDKNVISVHEGKAIGLQASDTPVTVWVRSKTNPSIAASVSIKVNSATFNGVTKLYPQKIQLNYGAASLSVGTDFTLTAEVLPHKISDEYKIVWSSDYEYNPALNEVGADGKTGYERAGIGWVNVKSDDAGKADEKGLSATVSVGGVFKEEISGITGPVVTARLYTREDSNSEWERSDVVTSCFVGVAQTYDVAYNVLKKYNGNEKVVVVPDNLGIKTIGSAAFMENMYLEEVTIPEGISVIESAAFAYCPLLKIVNLPASLVTIGDWAFAAREPKFQTGPSISSLEEVNIEKYADGTRKLRTVGSRAFLKCEKLLAIDLSTVTSIGKAAFNNCILLAEVDLSSAKAIGEVAFYTCLNLSKVTFCDGANIGDAAFYKDAKLVSLELPVSSIGFGAFYQCVELQNNTIVSGLQKVKFVGDGPVTINEYAFINCLALNSIDFGNTVVPYIGDYAFAAAQQLTSITLPDGLEYLGSGAFELCGNLVSVRIPEKVRITKLDSGAVFLDCAKLTTITVDSAHPYLAAENNIVFNIEDGTIIMSAPNTNFGNLTFPEKVKRIGAYAYAGTKITSVNLNGIEEVGNGAFKNCTELTSVSNFVNPNKIGAYAFDGCANLISIPFAQGDTCNLSSIGAGAFRGCTSLTGITLPEDITAIADYTFYNCQSLKTITFDGTVTSIGSYAFTNSGIATIDLKDVTVIREAAFMLCQSLVSVDLDKVTFIGNYAFQRCEKLQITELKSVTSIGSYSFAWCSSIEELSMPEVKIIGDYAFSGKFHNPIFVSEPYASDPLQPVVAMPSADNANKANLKSITIGKVEIIGVGAFMNTNLTTITLPESLNIVYPYAFSYCMSLEEIKVNGNNKRFFDDDGVLYGYVPKQNMMYNSNTGAIENYSENSLQLIAYPAARVAERVTVVRNGHENTYNFYQVMAGTNRIEAGAFINSSLEWLDLPFELSAIGHEAFYQCMNLKVVDFHSYQAPSLETVITSEYTTLWAQSPQAYDYKTYNLTTAYYSNFVFAIADKNNVKTVEITYPANGAGYKTHLYNQFFASIESTDEFVPAPATQSFYDSVWALPNPEDMDYYRDEPIVKELEKAYNLMTEDQKQYISEETVKRLRDARAWLNENVPAEGTGCCKGCGCGTISFTDIGTGGMMLGGGILMLIATALFVVFRRKRRA